MRLARSLAFALTIYVTAATVLEVVIGSWEEAAGPDDHLPAFVRLALAARYLVDFPVGCLDWGSAIGASGFYLHSIPNAALAAVAWWAMTRMSSDP